MDLTIIKHAVEADDGAKRLSMRFIKKYAARDRIRLSSELCEQISAELDKLDLVTLPRTLPTSENEYVWIIQKSGVLGEVVYVATVLANLEKLGANPIPKLFDNYPQAKAGLI